MAGEILQCHDGGLRHHGVRIFQRFQQSRHRFASAASRQCQRCGHADFAGVGFQVFGQRRSRLSFAAQGEPLRGGNLERVVFSAQEAGQCGQLIAARGFRRITKRAAVERGAFAEPFELQIHQAGDAGIVAAEPMRVALANQLHGRGSQCLRRACGKRRGGFAWLMAANAGATFAGPHVEPGHFIQLGTTLGIDGLQSDWHVGRHFDEERSVRREWHGAQFDGLVADVNNVGVRRARGQRHRAKHANGADAFPVGLALGGDARVLTEQETRRARLSSFGGVHEIGNDRRARASADKDRRMNRAVARLEDGHDAVVARIDDA